MSTRVLQALYAGDQESARTLAETDPLSLAEAAALGDLVRVQAELESRQAVDTPSPDGWPPLHLAAFFGHHAVVERLLASGAAINQFATSVQGNTALHAALAGAGEARVIAALLAAGADVNAPDAHQVRPIHLAASRGRIDWLELLFGCGAHLALPLPDGTRAVELAQQRGHEAAAGWLMRADAVVEAT